MPRHCEPKLFTKQSPTSQNGNNLTSPLCLDSGVNVIHHTEQVELAENWYRN